MDVPDDEDSKEEVRESQSTKLRALKTGSLSPMRLANELLKKERHHVVVAAAAAFNKYDVEQRTKQLARQQGWLRRSAMVVGLAGLGLAILESELRHANDDDVTDAMNGLKVAISVLTCVLLALIGRKYVVGHNLNKLHGYAAPSPGMLWMSILAELIVCAPHPFPWVHHHVYADNYLTASTLDYTADALLSGWMVLRIYLCLPVLDDLGVCV